VAGVKRLLPFLPHNPLAIPDKSAKSGYKCAINEYEQLSGFHTYVMSSESTVHEQ